MQCECSGASEGLPMLLYRSMERNGVKIPKEESECYLQNSIIILMFHEENKQ